MSKELLSKIKELYEKIRLLEIENSDWTNRAEDIYLFASTSEKIGQLSERKNIFETVLENISIIKNIPYCAFGNLQDGKINIEAEYASFTEKENIAEIIVTQQIIEELLSNQIVINNCENGKIGIDIFFKEVNFSPASCLIIPFSNISESNNLLICVDNNKREFLDTKQNTIQHAVSVLNTRLDNLYLIKQLAAQNDLLESKVQKRTAEFLKAKEIAEKSNSMKSEFLAQMSHEIRTPINTILNFISLIETDIEDKICPELSDSFSIIHSASKRITRTMDLILNMSELQSGSYEIIPKEIDLFNDVMKHLQNEFKGITDKKKIDFIINCSADCCKIMGDEYSVTQIFVNLVDNAIKYTSKGSVNISIKNNDEGRTIVEVSDTGIGISEQYLTQIFTPFTQETQGYTRKFDGNGLGLSLVKQYCEMNNAQIEVESEKEKGSTFRVIF